MAKRAFNTEVAKKILKGIVIAAGVSGGVLVLAALPGLGVVLKKVFEGYNDLRPKDRHRVRMSYEAIRRARLITVRQITDGKIEIMLTSSGKKKLLQYRLKDMHIAKQKVWDRTWRIVIFDLPKRYARVRNLWRGKLKALGFVQLQRSVWVYPYPCRHEIDFVSEYFGISPYIRLLETSAFDGSVAYEEMFALR